MGKDGSIQLKMTDSKYVFIPLAKQKEAKADIEMKFIPKNATLPLRSVYKQQREIVLCRVVKK